MSHGLYYVIECKKKFSWKDTPQIIDELNKRGFGITKTTPGNYEIGHGNRNGEKEFIKMRSTKYGVEYYSSSKNGYADVMISFNYTLRVIEIYVYPHFFADNKELSQKIGNLIAIIRGFASDLFGIKSIEKDWI